MRFVESIHVIGCGGIGSWLLPPLLRHDPTRVDDVELDLAMVALARFPLSQEKMAEIRLQLEARRGKV